jgi:hypothetical protein
VLPATDIFSVFPCVLVCSDGFRLDQRRRSGQASWSPGTEGSPHPHFVVLFTLVMSYSLFLHLLFSVCQLDLVSNVIDQYFIGMLVIDTMANPGASGLRQAGFLSLNSEWMS